MCSDHVKKGSSKITLYNRWEAGRSSLLVKVSAFSLVLTANPALAQDNAPTVEDNVIIVTAQRREEALEDVPMTVSVVTSETMAAAGVTSMKDLESVTTGFQFGMGGSFPQPAIRGVTTVINGTYENNVAVYIDGFYQVAPQALGIDLPNVDNVQILKGPQGTLYGRNATGGAILLTTVSPDDTWKGKAELTYARFDDKRAGAYLSGPISGNVGFSVAGYMRRSDGYITLASRTIPGKTVGNATPLSQDSVRLKLQADLSDDVRAILGYNYTHTSDARGLLFSATENVSPQFNTRPGGNTRPIVPGVMAFDHGAIMATKQHDVTLTIEAKTALGTLRSYSGYSIFKPRTYFDFDGSYIQTGFNGSAFRQRTIQQSVDFTVDAIDSVNLVVGGMYFNDDLHTTKNGLSTVWSVRTPTDPTIPPPFSNLDISIQRFIGQKKEAWALYGDITVDVADRLSINAGGRYSSERQDQATQFLSGSGAVTFPLTGGYATANATFSQFTPRASVRFELSPRSNIYASYSKGFRSGAFAGFPPGNNIAAWIPAKQEVVDAFEIGFKSSSRILRFELAGFYYDYKNLQVSVTQAIGIPPSPIVVVTNSPSAEIYGAEASFDFKPIDNLNIRGGATWLHARYGPNTIINGIGVDPARLGINPNSDPLKTYLNVSQDQDLSGLTMVRAPKYTANLGADYLIPNGDGGLLLAVNAKYSDRYVIRNPSVWGPLVAPEFRRVQRFQQGEYVLLNASVTWTHSSGHFYTRLWGKNLTDVAIKNDYTGNAAWGSYYQVGEPRTFGVTLGFTFDP